MRASRGQVIGSSGHADVAELVDAQVSGTCGGNTVRVQVSPSASLRFQR